VAISANSVGQVQPPALPQAPVEYSTQYQDQFNNILRLFFTNLDSTVDGLLAESNGGAALFIPRLFAYSTSNQVAATINTATPVGFGVVNKASGVSVGGTGNTEITVVSGGYWEVAVSLQVNSDSDTLKTITVWLVVNNVAVPYSAHATSFAKTGLDQINYTFKSVLAVNDVLRFEWATTDTGATLATTVPTSPHPGIPSATIAIAYQSNERV